MLLCVRLTNTLNDITNFQCFVVQQSKTKVRIQLKRADFLADASPL
jgi:hypothetical protein